MANLNLKKKDDIVIKLTECLDKSRRLTTIENTVVQKAVNHGKIMALKWVLGYDELDEIEKEEDDDWLVLPDGFREIDMSKL